MSRADDEDFRSFVVTSSPALLRVAFLLTGDRGHAEDLLQTALMKSSRRWADIKDRQAAYAYVRRVMINTQTSWLRRRRVVENFVDVVPEMTGPEDLHATEGKTLPALAQLPPGMRAVLVLRFPQATLRFNRTARGSSNSWPSRFSVSTGCVPMKFTSWCTSPARSRGAPEARPALPSFPRRSRPVLSSYVRTGRSC